MTATRSPNPIAGSDSIIPQDDKQQVQWNYPTANTVYLQAGTQSIGVDIVSVGAGVVTLQAINGASINGTVNGSFALTRNTPYRLMTPGAVGNIPASYFVK
jgi:hypothetical protein